MKPIILTIFSILFLSYNPTLAYMPEENLFINHLPINEDKTYEVIDEFYATVTAYNTVPEQTDNSPCIAAKGDNICGRTDIVACSRRYSIGSRFIINGDIYTCLDRLAMKYDNRIDISYDKDIRGAREFGRQYLKVKQIKEPSNGHN